MLENKLPRHPRRASKRGNDLKNDLSQKLVLNSQSLAQFLGHWA